MVILKDGHGLTITGQEIFLISARTPSPGQFRSHVVSVWPRAWEYHGHTKFLLTE